jgi:hypothetical protein
MRFNMYVPLHHFRQIKKIMVAKPAPACEKSSNLVTKGKKQREARKESY